jgi:hypothetical protein
MHVCVVVAPRTVLRSIRSVAAGDAVNDNIDNSLEESTVDGLAGEQPEMDRAEHRLDYLAELGIRRELPAFNRLLDDDAV